jgi:glutathione synthase/RimK-type ligase-like ATP-grasp enzyme
MSTVLITGSPQDPQAKRVAKAIRSLGAEAVYLNSESFPDRVKMSIEDGVLRIGSKRYRKPSSVYLRGFHAHALPEDYEQEMRDRPKGLMAQMDEKLAFLSSAMLTYEAQGVPVVNGPWANAQHSNKPYQLALLKDAGLRVPAWIATNEPTAVRRFVKKHGATVYKPLSGGATVRAVEERDLSPDRLSALQYAPVLFQKRIDGISVRAYVVGNKVVAAAELHSTELDYRRKEDAVVATNVSAEERRMVVAAAKACDMRFSGVDFIRGARKPYLLECNPSPMFAVFEDKTGLSVSEPFARYLVKGGR